MVPTYKQELIDAIEKKRGRLHYSSWTIGITKDPDQRKREHNSDRKAVYAWRHWLADSLEIAEEVKSYFRDARARSEGQYYHPSRPAHSLHVRPM